MTWRLVDSEGRPAVEFAVMHPNGKRGMGGHLGVGGDLVRTLRAVIEQVESFFLDL